MKFLRNKSQKRAEARGKMLLTDDREAKKEKSRSIIRELKLNRSSAKVQKF